MPADRPVAAPRLAVVRLRQLVALVVLLAMVLALLAAVVAPLVRT